MQKCVLFGLLLAGLVTAQPAQNVFVVVIDGMRNMEGFESESLYLRHMWNDLKPQGTINRKFWDRGYTVTTAGHTTILSGVRQVLLNNASHDQEVRSFDPLMFEYYRKAFGTPESSCGAVTGKWGNVGDIADFALEPAYGEPFKGARFGDTTTGADSMCSRRVHAVMDSVHPRLVLVNLGDVDHQGHLDTFEHYVQAIRDADSIIYDFWKHIQAIPPYTDTFYRNRTALIVTSDHGRHDDAHGGFQAHGNWDHGCRHIVFLALGPGIAQNRVIDNIPRDQIDIAPTVGALMGFPTPFAEGQVMSELFGTDVRPPTGPGQGEPIPLALNLSNNAGFSRDPDIARDRSGNLYCVWSDNSSGHWSVFYRKSSDNGVTWQAPQTMFNYPSYDSLMCFARVAADDSIAVSAMGYGKVTNWTDSACTRLDTTFVWYPWIATSADAGTNWNTTSLIDSNMVSYYAPVSVRNGRYGLGWIATGQFNPDTNGIEFNHRTAGGAWRSLPSRPLKQKNPIHVTIADDGTNFHAVATVFQTEDWDLRYAHSTDGDSWSTPQWIVNDPAGSPVYDYDPEIVTDDSNKVHLVWSRKPNVGGVWQVMYGRLDSVGNAWDTFRLTSSSAGAWQPHIAAKGCTLALVWIDYRDGNPELYSMFSIDRGRSWSTAERITYTEALTHHPRVVPTSQGFYVVWQDMQTGNWEIYGRQIGRPVGRDAGVVQILSPSGSVDSSLAFSPIATFRNYGPLVVSLKAYFRIQDSVGGTVYSESTGVADIPSGGEVSQAFPEWPKPHALGHYSTWCLLSLLGDSNNANDMLGGAFAVMLPPAAWRQKADFPLGPKSKRVKDGCCLGYDEKADTGFVYALKGNNSCEFYSYNVASNVWMARESIPAIGLSGRKKSVKKGSFLASGPPYPSYIFAAKGNGTLEFWQYDPYATLAYPWMQLPDVPLGAKTLREGTGAVPVKLGDTTFVYLLKGSNTVEFYRYHDLARAWQTMASAPLGISNTGFRYGSGIAYDGDSLIYAIKARKDEFYSYNVRSNIWDTLPVLPLIGRAGKKKAVAAGGGIVAVPHSPLAYVMKGDNTLEFWSYVCDSGKWTQCLDVPTGGGKKVKGGGALAYAADISAIYATKGSNTLEFYQYWPAPAAYSSQLTANRPAIEADAGFVLRPSSLVITPNPFTEATTISYSLPAAGNITLRLYDPAGKCVATLAAGHRPAGRSSFVISPSSLARGIYLLRLETRSSELQTQTMTQKLIIE